jgi:predicted AlkP superfamily pyrophosphatase or phosphodiesterase
MAAIRSGKAPRIASLLGKERGSGLFEHAYAAPQAWTILPSSTIAAWSAIFTGKPPAANGVPGDEWFVRETATFYAPVPVSVLDTLDVTKVVNDNLLGKSLRVPTLYEILGKRSNVSLLYVHNGATLYTTVAPSSFVDMVGRLISGTMDGDDPENSLSAGLDINSVQKLTEAIDVQGVPDLQVVYFPGIDIFTHLAKDQLVGQVRYLESITDKAVGAVLDAYETKNSLSGTYVIFIADHGQTAHAK